MHFCLTTGQEHCIVVFAGIALFASLRCLNVITSNIKTSVEKRISIIILGHLWKWDPHNNTGTSVEMGFPFNNNETTVIILRHL